MNPNEPNPSAPREVRDTTNNKYIRLQFEQSFNNLYKDAMDKEDQAKFIQSAKCISRWKRYGIFSGLLLTVSPSLIAKFTGFYLSDMKLMIRFPIHVTLFAAPLAIGWFCSKSVIRSREVQAELFDRYTAMDPRILMQRLLKANPNALKEMYPGNMPGLLNLSQFKR